MPDTRRSLAALLFILLLLCGSFAGCTRKETDTASDMQAADTASDTQEVDTESGTQESGTEDSDSSEPVEQGLVRIALSSSIDTMDVHKNTEDYMIPLNIFERLFDIRVNEDGSKDRVCKKCGAVIDTVKKAK